MGTDPLRTHDPLSEDDLARRRGADLWAQMHALGLSDAELLSDEAVEMTVDEMSAWLGSGAPSPLRPLP